MPDLFKIKSYSPLNSFSLSAFFLIFLMSPLNPKFNQYVNSDIDYQLDGIDGPYIIDDQIIRVNESNRITSEKLESKNFLVTVNNQDKDQFEVTLFKNNRYANFRHRLPEKLIAISDIEGNFNGFSSFLMSNQVIDEDHNWIFGSGELVLVGDFVDRGNDVIQVLWLIYELERQAQEAGGKVHFIIGNHEVLNIQGRFDYAQNKYKRLALELGDYEEDRSNYKLLFSKSTVLGNWMRTKNVIEKIGPYLFVHGGLSPKILAYELDLGKVNKLSRHYWEDTDVYSYEEMQIGNFFLGPESPIWYRGFVSDSKTYDKITASELNKILKTYRSEKFVIGHTLVKDISYGFDRKVIRLDIPHGKEKRTGHTKGLLVLNGQEYIVDDLGHQTPLR